MGRDEIRWGSEDHWTFTPHKMAKIQAELTARMGGAPDAAARAGGAGGGGGRGGRGGGRGGSGLVDGQPLYEALTAKQLRDPRGFILPSDQPDFGTATRFVNALIKAGVVIHRATAPFTVAGTSYPANSFVVKTAQAFRPHVMDMFEPQDHPDDIPYPGGTPTSPYDVTGYTLAWQMGVQFDRILDAFDGPFERLAGFAKPVAAPAPPPGATGYYFSHQTTDSFIAINRLLAADEEVRWLSTGPLGAGTFYVAARPSTAAILNRAASELGVRFAPASSAPSGPATRLRPLRIGLFDQYGGSMPSGWTRLILENFEFPYTVVFPPDLDAGNLRAKFDVLVFNDVGLGGGGGGRGGGGAGGGAGGGRGGGGGRAGFTPQPIPPDFARRQGQISAQTMAQIQQFVMEGGAVIGIASAANGLITQFRLPLSSHLVEGGRPLGNDKYYVPGSVLRVAVDPKNPVAHGYGDQLDIFFDNSPVWRLDPAVGAPGIEVRTVAWFANDSPLRSGWAWGQQYLDKGLQIVEANIGKGRVFLFGNELLFRSQPHGSYKLFFNALYLSAAPELR
jgi:hypothetical protein